MTFDNAEAWLAAFRTEPLPRLEALLGGRDRIAPYFRTDGAELLAMLLPRAGAPDPHGDVPRLDAALREWFAARLAAPLPEPARWNAAASQAARGIDLVIALAVPETAAWLAARRNEATAWASAHTRPTSQDLRVALGRALACYHNKPLVKERGA